MKTKTINIEFRNGLLMAMLLGLYFMVLVILEWSDNMFFKLGNALIAGVMVYHSIKASKTLSEDKTGRDYITHFLVGLRTGVIGTAISLVGLGVFIYAFPDSYADLIKASIMPVRSMTQFFVGLLIEGFSGSVIMTLIVMQYWKNYVFKKNYGFIERPQ